MEIELTKMLVSNDPNLLQSRSQSTIEIPTTSNHTVKAGLPKKNTMTIHFKEAFSPSMNKEFQYVTLTLLDSQIQQAIESCKDQCPTELYQWATKWTE